MERSTAKTMDCYAEFQSANDAQETATRINRIYETGRAPRLGNRSVDVEFSNQDTLLKDLFPRAKCIIWKDAMPTAVPNDDPFSTGFSGFFTSEEIVNAIRHAEIPHRVSNLPSIQSGVCLLVCSKLTRLSVSILCEVSSAHLRVHHQHTLQGKPLSADAIVRRTYMRETIC